MFDGADIIGRRPHQIAAAGMARTFQNVELFANLTVLDNLMLGRHTHLHVRHVRRDRLVGAGPAAGTRRPGRRSRTSSTSSSWSSGGGCRSGCCPYGVQKRVELGRALAMQPKLLLLDEPVAGMNLEETEDMARYILDIRDELDIPIILVEHDMGLVMDLADRVMVVDFGVADRHRRHRPRSSAIPDVIRAYLGEVQQA